MERNVYVNVFQADGSPGPGRDVRHGPALRPDGGRPGRGGPAPGTQTAREEHHEEGQETLLSVVREGECPVDGRVGRSGGRHSSSGPETQDRPQQVRRGGE